MPLAEPVSSFFTSEWSRFRDGVNGLDPRVAGVIIGIEGGRFRRPGEATTINIPGWDQVIHLGPRLEVTSAQWGEYYRAQRAGRAPALERAVLDEIAWKQVVREAQRTSAQPDWARAWGQIMTSIDNVQDFLSSIATFARLALWGGVPALNFLLPGFEALAAQRIGLEAARRMAAQLALELGGRAGWNAAFIDASAKAVARAAAQRAALGFGARVLLRFVPGIGWVILASDLLNVMNLLGLVAMPFYALLCNGPREALAAGVPAAVLKSALCREVWTMARLNPFSRQARMAARLRALGRLPSIGNILEVMQTTDQLFGYGISLGGIYGAALEAIFAGTSDSPWSNTSINWDQARSSVGLPTRSRVQTLGPADHMMLGQAARVLTGAPFIASHSDWFPDDIHQTHLIALLEATAQAHNVLSHPDTEEWLPQFLASSIPAPSQVGRTARAMLEAGDLEPAGIGTWPLPGHPTHATGAELVHGFAPQITRALSDYLKPRRNRRDAAFTGALVGQLTENLWYMIGGGPDALRFELTPDFKLLTGMASDGLLIPANADPKAAWRFWCAMRAELERRGGKLLEASKVLELARSADCPIMRLLAPGAALPNEWAKLFASVDPDAAEAAQRCPTCGKPET